MQNNEARGAIITRNSTNTKATPPNTETPDKSKTHCAKCDKILKGDQVQCKICDLWFHIACQGMSQEKFKALTTFPDIHWYCKSCDNATAKIYKTVTALQQEVTGVKEDIKQIKANVQDCQDKFNNLQTRITTEVDEEINSIKTTYTKTTTMNHEIDIAKAECLENMQAEFAAYKTEFEEEMNGKLAALQIKPTDDTDEDEGEWEGTRNARRLERRRNMHKEMNEAAAEAVAESARIEKRKLNLIASNIQEPTTPNGNIEKLRELLRVKMNITEDIVITNPTRIGDRTIDRNRMLKFTVQDMKTKKIILQKATSLRELPDDDEFHNVYVQPDLTPKQVAVSKNLRAELKRTREENPEKKYKIYRGKIVELNADGEVLVEENHI